MGRVCQDGKKSTVELPTHRREKWNDGDVEGRRVRGTQMRNCAHCWFFPQGSGPRRGRGGCSCSSVTSSIAPFSLPFPRVLGIEGGSSSFSSGREGGKLLTSHPPEPVVDKGSGWRGWVQGQKATVMPIWIAIGSGFPRFLPCKSHYVGEEGKPCLCLSSDWIITAVNGRMLSRSGSSNVIPESMNSNGSVVQVEGEAPCHALRL